jgi:hypothetical protein
MPCRRSRGFEPESCLHRPARRSPTTPVRRPWAHDRTNRSRTTPMRPKLQAPGNSPMNQPRSPATSARQLGRKTRCHLGDSANILRRQFGQKPDQKKVRNTHLRGAPTGHVEAKRTRKRRTGAAVASFKAPTGFAVIHVVLNQVGNLL